MGWWRPTEAERWFLTLELYDSLLLTCPVREPVEFNIFFLCRTLEVDFLTAYQYLTRVNCLVNTHLFSHVRTFNPGRKFSCKTSHRTKQFCPQIEYRIFWGVPHFEMHTKTAKSHLRLRLGMLGMTTNATALYEYTACMVLFSYSSCTAAHHCTGAKLLIVHAASSERTAK